VIKVAIIGAGYGMQAHFPAFSSLSGVTVEMIANSGGVALNGYLPSGIKYCATIDEVLRSSVDVVCVATPPRFQANIALKVLSADKHLFCEKPFGINYQQAKKVLDKAIEKPNLVTAVNFQYRFEPMLLKLHQLISSGDLGSLRWINFSWITSGKADPLIPWTWRNSTEDGGGVLGGFVCHMIDLVAWLTSQPIMSVAAKLRAVIQERPADLNGPSRMVTADDTAIVQMEMEGLTAQLRVTNCQWGGDGMRLEIGGSNGIALFKNKPPFRQCDQTLELFDSKGNTTLWNSSGFQHDFHIDSRSSALTQLASKFIQSIKGFPDPDLPTPHDAIYVQRILDAIKNSSIQQRVIEV
jgi:predicted dehydrogenase